MDWNDRGLLAVLPGILANLARPDALQLACTNKAVRQEVLAAWRSVAPFRQVAALVVASADNDLVLLNALTGKQTNCVPISLLDDAPHQYWPTHVAVDVAGQRCWVCQYDGPRICELLLPGLEVRRWHSMSDLVGSSALVGGPEGIAAGNTSLYVAWTVGHSAVSATPFTYLPDVDDEGTQQQPAVAVREAAGQHTLSGRKAAPPAGPVPQRSRCTLPRGADWVLWSMRLGPDGALYASANPSYPFKVHYGAMPSEPGRGNVVRVPLNARGELQGSMEPFCHGSLLSRPSGVCFDGEGDLYVTHMGCQVIKYQGPHRENPGQPVGVFIDTRASHHVVSVSNVKSSRRLRDRQQRLSPDPQVHTPIPFDICWHDGIFYVTTHTCIDGRHNHGCLSLWDPRGQLLRAHKLPNQHPNGLVVFPLQQPSG